MQSRTIKKLLLISLIPLSLGCRNKNQPENSNLKDTDATFESAQGAKNETAINSEFSNYLEAIPYLTLPYATACYNDYPDSPEIDEQAHAKFTRELEWPYRRIATEANFAAVMNLAPADCSPQSHKVREGPQSFLTPFLARLGVLAFLQ